MSPVLLDHTSPHIPVVCKDTLCTRLFLVPASWPIPPSQLQDWLSLTHFLKTSNRESNSSPNSCCKHGKRFSVSSVCTTPFHPLFAHPSLSGTLLFLLFHIRPLLLPLSPCLLVPILAPCCEASAPVSPSLKMFKSTRSPSTTPPASPPLLLSLHDEVLDGRHGRCTHEAITDQGGGQVCTVIGTKRDYHFPPL
jgi:hypothetical protein